MSFPEIPPGQLANQPIGEYDTFVDYLNAVASAAAQTPDTSALLVKANNLSDVASAATARQNLDLGDSATRDVGTGAGTVAAGDDSRLTDARTPTDGSVSTVKIADGAVTPIKVGSRYVAKTSAYTLTAADEVVDCTSGTFTVTLPSAAGVAGRMFTVKNSGTGVITIGRTSSQTIDGVNANVVLGGKGSFTVLSTGAAWIVIQGSYTDESVGRRIFTWDQVNGRWQMTYGDTGWRDVTANLINSWTTGPGGWVRIRRIDNTVHLSSFYVVGSGASSNVMMLQIAGFMSNLGNVTRIPIVDNTVVRVMTVAPGASFIFAEYASVFNMSLNGVSWITNDAWPSSLPGTAVGSIPT